MSLENICSSEHFANIDGFSSSDSTLEMTCRRVSGDNPRSFSSSTSSPIICFSCTTVELGHYFIGKVVHELHDTGWTCYAAPEGKFATVARKSFQMTLSVRM